MIGLTWAAVAAFRGIGGPGSDLAAMRPRGRAKNVPTRCFRRRWRCFHAHLGTARSTAPAPLRARSGTIWDRAPNGSGLQTRGCETDGRGVPYTVPLSIQVL